MILEPNINDSCKSCIIDNPEELQVDFGKTLYNKDLLDR